VVTFPPVSPPRPYTSPSPHTYAPHAHPISFFSILSPAQYWVRSTNHLAPCKVSITYFLTYLLTPRFTVLPEQLTGLQLVKKFPAFHGTPRFITALISVRQLSILGQPNPVHITTSHLWRSILILSTHLRLCLPIGLFPFGFHTKTLYTPLSYPIRATCPARLFRVKVLV
jgi:hypothetical protein